MAQSPQASGALRLFLLPQLRWAAGYSLVLNIALLAPSLYMLQVYDRVLVTRSVETLVMLTVITALTLLAYGLLDQTRSRLLTVAGMSLEQRFGPLLLQQAIVQSARQVPGASGELLRDLGQLRAFLSGPGVVGLFDAPWAVLYILLIGAFDWRLGAVALGAALLLLALTAANERRVRAGLSDTLADTRAAGRWAERSVANAEVVTALGMSQTLSQRWAGQTASVHDRSLAVNARTGLLTASTRTLRQLVQVLMMGLGAWLVIHEGASPGVMIATTIILGRALAPVEQLIAGWNALTEARLAFARLQQQLDRPAEGEVGTTLPRPSGRIQVEGLTHAAPESGRLLLRQASFEVAPGEIVAMVGNSGAGKTTLARLLVGVLRPSAGAVRLDGADIRQFDPQRLGAALGYLPQDVELFAGTVAQNIARFTEGEEPAHSAAVIAAAQAAGAHELILRLPQGYDTPVGEGGRRLSGGQRQRVALARALFGDPAVVVLDEPDASLDAEGEEALVGALQGLKARGATVITVTQRRRLLSVADKLVVLQNGQVERVATRQELQAQAAAGPGGAAGSARPAPATPLRGPAHPATPGAAA
ncbi:type I secretion system permease/ATPase [Ideonella livida]|uniref:Type I secretion system permease/ATPase n=1 Tax=Ideonella livida TaxID=2707176 RepID=A0A7C9TIV4_9BURK|nr:type I secretion system permease/ATPase [Ideonella livida]NDY91500.1 type I secretion system permease/ATPase [Ideonella livida]